MLFIPFIIFILGLLVGSFLNVVILRMNTGRSFVTGRSKCARCNHKLAWYELIPVFSFLGLRGKCRTCSTPISFQYPLVELLTAIVFTLLYNQILLTYGFTSGALISFVFGCSIASLLIIIMVYDLKHQIIPDPIVYPFILLALISIAYKALTIPHFSWIAALINGVLVALPFFLLWHFSKGRAMGFGDVKLALGMGWLVGLSIASAAIIISFWIGGFVGLVLLSLPKKQYSMKSALPFAPFLIVGLCIASVWGIPIQSLFPLWQ